MKRDRKAFIGLLCAIAFVAMLIAPALYAADKPVTISGVVTALKSAKGKVTSVSIQTDQGEKYMVAKTGKGKELMKLADKKVEATGTVKESKGKKTITIAEYKVLAPEAKPEAK